MVPGIDYLPLKGDGFAFDQVGISIVLFIWGRFDKNENKHCLLCSSQQSKMKQWILRCA